MHIVVHAGDTLINVGLLCLLAGISYYKSKLLF